MTDDKKKVKKKELDKIAIEEKRRFESLSAKRVKRRKMVDDDSDERVVMSGPLGWVEKIILLSERFGVKKLLQAVFFIILFIAADFVYNALQSDNVVKSVIETINTQEREEHDVGSNVRGYVSPKINETLIKLVYELHADRAFVIEMHNGKENASSLPFVYFDMTYEEIREDENVKYVQPHFENININNYTMPWYLSEKVYFIGGIEEMKKIDKRLAVRFEDEGGGYCGLILVRSNGINIGFLGVSYKSSRPEVTDETIHNKLTKYVQDISSLLDLNKAKNIKED